MSDKSGPKGDGIEIEISVKRGGRFVPGTLYDPAEVPAFIQRALASLRSDLGSAISVRLLSEDPDRLSDETKEMIRRYQTGA